MRSKEVLAVGLVQDLLFRNSDALELYLYELEHRRAWFIVLDKFTRDDGSVIIRVVKQYNSCDLIKL